MRIVMLPALMLGALAFSASGGSADDANDADEAAPVGEIAQDVTGDFDSLSKAVVAPSYARGVAYSAESIAEFKAKEPDPTPHAGHAGHAGRR